MVARCIARRGRACARLGCHSLCRCTRRPAALGMMNEGVCGHEGGGGSPHTKHVHFIACTHLGLFLPMHATMQGVRCVSARSATAKRSRDTGHAVGAVWSVHTSPSRTPPCAAASLDALPYPVAGHNMALVLSASFRDGPETWTAWHLTARTTRARQSRRQPLCQATRSCAAASCHAGRRAGLGARLCSFALPRSGRA